MMDVDQPVLSTTEQEAKSSDNEAKIGNPGAKSPGVVGRENDDFPALLISDSEEDDVQTPKELVEPCGDIAAANDVCASGDISGVTPIESTVIDVDAEVDGAANAANCDESKATQVEEPTNETTIVSTVPDDDVENVDLTGVSSAENSGTSIPAPCYTTARNESEMTAQELLQSLIGIPKEHSLSDPPDEKQSSPVDCSDMIKFGDEISSEPLLDEPSPNISSKCIVDTSEQIIPKQHGVEKGNFSDATNTGTTPEYDESSILDTQTDVGNNNDTDVTLDEKSPSAMDEECLLEEMPNAPAIQKNKDTADDVADKTTSNNNAEEGDRLNVDDDNKMLAVDNSAADNTPVAVTDEGFDEAVHGEPPRKKSRSIEEVDVSTNETNIEALEQTGELNAETCVNHNLTDSTGTEGNEMQVLEVEPSKESERPPESNVEQDVPKNASAEKELPLVENDIKNDNLALVNEGLNIIPTTSSMSTDVLIIDDDDDVTVVSGSAQSVSAIAMDEEKGQALQKSTVAESPSTSGIRSSGQATIRFESSPFETNTESIKMEVLRRMAKPLDELNRFDLEQLVIQKIVETMICKSEMADMHKRILRQEMTLKGFKLKLADLTKHYGDLKIVSDRAVADMKKRANCFIAPVKITRAVGLQVSKLVCTPEPVEPQPPLPATVPEVTDQESLSRTSVTNGVAVGNERPKIPMPTTVGQQRHVIAVVNRQPIQNNTYTMAPNITNTLVNGGLVRTYKTQTGRQNAGPATVNISNPIRVATALSDGSAASPPATSLGAVSSSTESLSGASGNSSPGVVRKKLHKITPMRPRLPADQQALCEIKVRQHQEFLVQQIREQSQQAQRKAQMIARQDQPIGDNTAVRQAADGGGVRQRHASNIALGRAGTSSAQSPMTNSFQTTTPSRVPSATVTSTTPPVLQKARPTASSTSASDSLIDLTDEDETPRNSLDGNGMHLSAKRPRVSFNGPQPTQLVQLTQQIQMANNQMIRQNTNVVRIPQRTSGVVDVNGVVVVTAANEPTANVYHHNGGIVRANIVKRPATTAVLPKRVLNHSLRHAAPSNDPTKKRVLVKVSPRSLIPLPKSEPPIHNPAWKLPPPQPTINVNRVQTGIVISWTMPNNSDTYALIENYQIYAYQEVNNSTKTDEWRHVGDVRALLLPMAVTLTQFQEGQRYHFAVRAVDKHMRIGLFSDPCTWNDTSAS